MSYKFLKAILVGSAMTMGAFGLVACGDDSSSSAQEPTGPAPIVVPQQKDALIQFTNVGATIAGTNIRFTGNVNLDYTDTTAAETLQFTDMSLTVGKLDAAGGLTTTSATVLYNPVTFPRENGISLSEMMTRVDLTDPTFTECGKFQLVVTVKANDGQKDFSSTETIGFDRPDTYCAALVSSSSTTPSSAASTGIPMTAKVLENMSTNLMPGINLTTLSAEASKTADIVFSATGSGEMSVTSGTGVLFSAITNESDNNFDDDYVVDYWPEDVKGSAAVSDFKFKSIEKTSISSLIENSSTIYVAKTAAYDAATGTGFYAFAITEYKAGLNGDYIFSVKIYSK